LVGLQIERAAFIGNHTPRRCGIATFTADVAQAVAAHGAVADVVAMNDCREGYAYPKTVCFEVFQDDPQAYARAAEYLNLGNYDVACLQHEYGIFGGEEGDAVLGMLTELGVPLVTTLHTILREPSPSQKRVLGEIASLSERVVVMSRKGQTMLEEIYGISRSKVDFIPHGVPDVPFEDTTPHKTMLGVGERPMMLTFGLVSPDKGIENAILALPEVVRKHPDVLYLIVGETHPKIRAHSGEAYRERLEGLVEELDLQANVRFLNEFTSFEQLVEYLLAADVYVTPYLKLQQITSGTLSYALGCGKAIVSTPYWHAEELLADGRGMLVQPGSPGAISEAVIHLLDEPESLFRMRQLAYAHGRSMVWREVGKQYLSSFGAARLQSAERLCRIVSGSPITPLTTPSPNTGHLRLLTDDTGILQHSKFDVPDRNHGYCTDDNARALLVTATEPSGRPRSESLAGLESRYLGFLYHAFDEESGRFRNFMSYDRRWLEEYGSEDSHGRAIWALGNVVNSDLAPGIRSLAARLMGLALPAVRSFTSPRAWAFTLLGLEPYLNTFGGDRQACRAQKLLAYRLLDLYQWGSEEGWRWFEPIVAYDNARLPQALLSAGLALGDQDMKETALESLEWLCQIQTGPGGIFLPIGSNGFWKKGEARPWFDQQPVEACATIGAALVAYRASGENLWLQRAECAFNWFHGHNSLGQAVYDAESGGCRDGLQADRLNENKGAESALAYMQSLIEMNLARETAPTEEVRYLG
jgi:glycosyltransferase involved in cell wall biosynthesis